MPVDTRFATLRSMSKGFLPSVEMTKHQFGCITKSHQLYVF